MFPSKYEMFLFLFLFLLGFTDVTKKLEGALAEDVRVKESIHQQIHRMCLLRVKLMHFVNSLHNYIMTRVRQTVEQISKFPKMQILHLEYIYICIYIVIYAYTHTHCLIPYSAALVDCLRPLTDSAQHRTGVSAPSTGSKGPGPADKDSLQISGDNSRPLFTEGEGKERCFNTVRDPREPRCAREAKEKRFL